MRSNNSIALMLIMLLILLPGCAIGAGTGGTGGKSVQICYPKDGGGAGAVGSEGDQAVYLSSNRQVL